MTLTPEQMEEAVEAMARAYSGAPFPSHRSRDKARAALTAALPVIERAVLERAAHEVHYLPDFADHELTEYGRDCRNLAKRIRALADEVK